MKMDSKICGVCGDKALGYNFNAITCESCKAFFRRNALIQKDYKCPFANQCHITPVTRRFCQKCRLTKCFSIGMCKDLIMSEEDKVLKRQKIQENKKRKRSISIDEINNIDIKQHQQIKKNIVGYEYDVDNQCQSSVDDADGHFPQNSNSNDTTISNSNTIINLEKSTSCHNNNNLFSFENILNKQLQQQRQDDKILNNLNNERNKNQLNISQNNHPNGTSYINNNNNNNNNDKDSSNRTITEQQQPTGNGTAFDVLNEINGLQSESSTSSRGENPIDSILCEAIKLEYEAYSSLSQSRSMSKELNDVERAKLNELIVANKALSTPIDEELNLMETDFSNTLKKQLQGGEKAKSDPALLDVINLTAIGIRRLIKMAKKINAFKNLCQEDQVALLKGGCTEIMMIISAMKYDPTKHIWKIPTIQENLNVNVNILKMASGNAYQELERFVRTFDPKWRNDENIILILCAIVLFSPDRPKVVHQDVIKLEQNSYYYLLRRYLESIYVGCEAKSTFLKLIKKIMELHKVNEEFINVLLDVNPSQVEPLLIEIFDLK